MGAVLLLVGLLLGILIGAAIGYLFARGRLAAADERARAAEDRARMIERGAAERAALVEGQLAERFQALSAQALDASTARFLEVAEGRLRAANATAAGELELRRAAVEHLVEPLRETLARVEEQLRESDAARNRSHAALAEQVHLARHTSEQLRAQTQALVTALRRPEARGRWGELQLRRVVELAGMSARCDFDEQVTVATPDGAVRPDLVVRLAGGKNIVVDSKVSLAAYLEAAEADDDDVRTARLDAHARHVREHVDRLAAKAYWTALSPSPEFVILFIPGEAFLAPALERDPGLLEYALGRKVHIATPTTLVTMLRTAQYAWQQAGAGRERPRRVRPRPAALRADLRPGRARGPAGPRAGQGGVNVQPGGRLAGEPGAAERPQAQRARRGRRGAHRAGRGGGDAPGPVRPRTGARAGGRPSWTPPTGWALIDPAEVSLVRAVR